MFELLSNYVCAYTDNNTSHEKKNQLKIDSYLWFSEVHDYA